MMSNRTDRNDGWPLLVPVVGAGRDLAAEAAVARGPGAAEGLEPDDAFDPAAGGGASLELFLPWGKT
jgi:hypothetical protein